MSDGLPVDALALREEVKAKYRAVAVDPHGSYHFHTGRPLARRLGYDEAAVAGLPDNAVEAFAGVGNPFSLATLKPGERWSISAPEAVSTALSQRVGSGLKVALLAST
jgi:arsenite methyltransferase